MLRGPAQQGLSAHRLVSLQKASAEKPAMSTATMALAADMAATACCWPAGAYARPHRDYGTSGAVGEGTATPQGGGPLSIGPKRKVAALYKPLGQAACA